ncbi:cation-translocating P-type ATPase [Desulfogranum marinum]|uniref:cation-translocating P-type ATPase n=1 Tax=Desulfogranum marinum TaxID=453220 RepID=UPI0029C960B2|nr:cation-translocating P-type ATPase [Desulfogranum marinum]
MDGIYSISAAEILDRLQTSQKGLSQLEVDKRRRLYGANRIQHQPPVSAWRILIHQFTSFIIYLLLFAVLFSLVLKEYTDAMVILAILIMNGLIGFVQELRANRSLEALRKMTTITATVIRDNKRLRINGEQLVPGDIVCLESGDKVPADGRLINVTQLEVEESILTGESQAVPKIIDPLPGELPLADRRNMVFSASSIVSGRGVAVITGIGLDTEVGRISQMIAAAEHQQTPLERRLDTFGRKLGLVITGICLLVFCLLVGRSVTDGQQLDMKVFIDFSFVVISLAVAAVPTALPAVVTIALSIGTKRLLGKKILVRRLTSVETLGSCDVICSDKTGTLTRNRMTVEKGWTMERELDLNSPPEHKSFSFTERLLFTIGVTCNNAESGDQSGDHVLTGSPTECALLVSAATAGVAFHGERLSEIPFDAKRKCMSVLVRTEGGTFMHTKGAPDHLLQKCAYFQKNDSSKAALTTKERAVITKAINDFAGRSMRIMAFAYREAEINDTLHETGLVFVGLQAMIDPPRHDVAVSIQRARAACIRPIMITGDHKETAKSIGEQIGITGRVLTGKELDDMDDDVLINAVQTTDIFARVIPHHKLRIVQALQQSDHVVAMTGDGVNDAPALKKADIGIAVGSGTEVAKEAADFVVLNDSFTNIVDAVEEGRGIYDNIQKSIMLLLSGNLMELLLVFLAVILGWNLPLTALLLLWINLITDGAPALAYTVDPYSSDIMRRPPIAKKAPILSGYHLRLLLFLGVTGALIGLFCFENAGGARLDQEELERARTVAFTYVVFFEMLLVFVIRSSYRVRLFTNPWLWSSVALSLLLQGIILYTPVHRLFGVVSLTMDELIQLGVSAVVFGCCCFIPLGWARWKTAFSSG